MTLDWDYPSPYTLDFSPTEDDMDGLQHTNNTVYTKWCEVIGWSHSEHLGLSLSHYQALDRAMAITSAGYQYLLASVKEDKLILGTWLTESDNKLTLKREFQLINSQTGKTIFRGHWHLCCIAISTGRPKKMPSLFFDIYCGLVSSLQQQLES